MWSVSNLPGFIPLGHPRLLHSPLSWHRLLPLERCMKRWHLAECESQIKSKIMRTLNCTDDVISIGDEASETIVIRGELQNQIYHLHAWYRYHKPSSLSHDAIFCWIRTLRMQFTFACRSHPDYSSAAFLIQPIINSPQIWCKQPKRKRGKHTWIEHLRTIKKLNQHMIKNEVFAQKLLSWPIFCVNPSRLLTTQNKRGIIMLIVRVAICFWCRISGLDSCLITYWGDMY